MLVFFAFFALHGLMIYLLPEGALLYWVLMPLLVPLALACLIVIIQAALHPRQPLRGFLVLRLMGHVIEAAVLAVMVSGAFTGMDSPARRMVRAARHRGPDVYVETSRLMLSKTQGQLTDLARAWYVVAADPLAPFWLARWAQEYTRSLLELRGKLLDHEIALRHAAEGGPEMLQQYMQEMLAWEDCTGET